MSTTDAAGENAASPREQRMPGAGLEPARSEEQGILSPYTGTQSAGRVRTFARTADDEKRHFATQEGGKKGADHPDAYGWVYLVVAESGHAKIGRTLGRELRLRLQKLRSQNAVELFLVDAIYVKRAKVIEAQLHEMFAPFRAHHEWFLARDGGAAFGDIFASLRDIHLDGVPEEERDWFRDEYIRSFVTDRPDDCDECGRSGQPMKQDRIGDWVCADCRNGVCP